jgi:hypothetical protein
MNSKKNTGLTPAAIRAMVSGDIDNFIASSTPGGIEAQEARGQRDFVKATTLPTEGLDADVCKALGIVIGEAADNLFTNVQLPAGWTKKATDHSMWSQLIDDKGRKRAGIFYKAAWYDMSAHISFNRRYSASKQPVNGWHSNDEDDARVGVILDCDVEIWRSEPFERADYDAPYKVAKAKLDEMFPLNGDVLAYWNEA